MLYSSLLFFFISYDIIKQEAKRSLRSWVIHEKLLLEFNL
jgi:hypothetical protein